MKALKVKDIMMIGMYAALYFVHVGLGTLLGLALMPVGNMVLAPAMTGLIAGTVYFLLINKVPKFGALSLVGAVMAIFFSFSGYFALAFLPSLLCGLLADGLAYLGRYKNKTYNSLSYIIFSLGNFGPIFFMWIAREAYIERLLARGKTLDYVNSIMVDFSWFHLLLLVGCSLVGALIGQYMVKRYFKKAGLV